MTEATTAWDGIEPRGPMLRPAQAAAFLGVCTRNFYAMAKAGEVPKPVRLRPSGHSTGVPKSWLDAVVAARASAAA